MSSRAPTFERRVRLNISRPSSGIVGPEPDLSVRGSNVPQMLWYSIRHVAPMEIRSALIKPSYHTNDKVQGKFGHNAYYAQTRPTKGCVRTFDWSDEMVLAWTNFAHEYGIEYHGKHDYKIPKELLSKPAGKYGNPTPPYRWPSPKGLKPSEKEVFQQRKFLGLISHKRSEIAKMRRSARKAVKAVVKPLQKSDILTYRKSYPHRYAHRHRIADNPKALCFNDKMGKSRRIPDICVRAVENIFSRTAPLLVHCVPEPVQEMPSVIRSAYTRPKCLPKILKKGSIVLATKPGMTCRNSTIPRVLATDFPAEAVMATPPHHDGRIIGAVGRVSFDSWL